MQSCMQGEIEETAGAADQLRDENVSRDLFLDSRASDYTVHAASIALNVRL